MSATRIIAGLLLLTAIVGPPVIAGWRWQRSLSPRELPLRILATTVIALTIVLLTAQLLGSVGLFELAPLVAGSCLVSAGVYAWATRVSPAPAPAKRAESATARAPRWITVAVGLATLAVSVRWLAGMAGVWANGLHDTDTWNHHLTFSADFVQTGWVTNLYPVYPDPFAVLQPLNSELVQAIGMLAMDRDVLVPPLSLLWPALLLLAGWCAGIRDGVSPFTLLGVAWVVGIPTVIVTNAGTAGNDIATLALLGAAVALWRNSDYDAGWLALTGLALGLAVGVKVTALAPAGLLTLAILALAPRERRRVVLGVLAAGIAVGGAFWYVRLLARTGSPLPALDLPLLPSLDLPVLDERGHTVAHYLTDGDVWRDVYEPGVRYFFGLSGVLALIAIVVAAPRMVRGRHRMVLALGACALVSGLVYLVTPAGAFGREGDPDPVLFWVNLRYALPALLLLLLTAGIAMGTAGARLRAWYAGLLLAAVTAAVLRHGVVADVPEFMQARLTARGIALAGLVILAVVAARRIRVAPAWKWAAAGAAVVLAAAVAGPTVTRHYLDKATLGPDPAANELYDWAAELDDAYIGEYALNSLYPLLGQSWQNRVEYVGVHGPRGAFRAVANCREYIEVLDRRRFDYVVLAPSKHVFQDLDLPRWTATQAKAAKVVDAPPYSVFTVAPPYDPDRCNHGAGGRTSH